MLSRRDPFQSLAANPRVMIWTSGPNNSCNWVNRAWLDFTGRTIEQELGNGWAEGVHPDDLSTCLSTYTTAFDCRREFNMEYRLRRYDGVYRWVLDIGGPYFSDDGKFLGYFGSCIDVTDSKHHNDASRTAQPELDRLGLNTSIGEGAGESIPLERQFGAIPTEAEIRAHSIGLPAATVSERRRNSRHFCGLSSRRLCAVKRNASRATPLPSRRSDEGKTSIPRLTLSFEWRRDDCGGHSNIIMPGPARRIRL